MSISMGKPVLAGAVIALMMPISGAHAQVVASDVAMKDVARTPLEDFNIHSKDIPEILVQATQDPYDMTGMQACNDLVGEIAALDNTLGRDFDLPREEASRISVGRLAKSLVGSLIPFRRIVREVTGANKKQEAFELAVTAGMVRRAYLKGIGETRGCSYPARPRNAKSSAASTESASSKSDANIPPNIDRNQ